MLIASAICCMYYNMIIAWVLYYLGNSFVGTLPWSHCENPWNTIMCSDGEPNATFGENSTIISPNLTFQHHEGIGSNISFDNATNVKSPAEEFWE